MLFPATQEVTALVTAVASLLQWEQFRVEPVAPPLVRTEGNSLGYMKEHKWQLLLKGKTAVYKLRCTVCPQQGQIWRVDCKYPKYHRGLMQTDGVLPLASFCKGKGQDFILHVHRKKHALISWITIFVK